MWAATFGAIDTMDLSVYALSLLLVLGALTLYQVIYWLYFPGGLVFGKRRQDLGKEELPAVSVIIAARNEADHLAEFLPKILEQDYPSFEVVVVNDGSWDETSEILESFAARYKSLKLVNVGESIHAFAGKKLALTLGVKAAKNPVMVFTDADCFPASKSWLRQMVSGFGDQIEVVLGYGAYIPAKGFLNKIVRADTLINAVHFLGSAMRRKPYMGVGRNLAYKKTTYERVGGFRSHYSIASGDDDLFVQQVANHQNVAVIARLDAITYSTPPKNWSRWWMQKRRHLTTGWKYKMGVRSRLAFYNASLWLWLAAIIACFIYPRLWPFALGALVLRIALQILIFSKANRYLGERDLLPWISILEWPILIFTSLAQVANTFSKPKGWKR